MRHFTARRLALAALVPALFLLSVIPGCSNEGEGERCGDPDGDVSNNDDCQSGLTCTPFPLNDGTTNTVGRCCYKNRVTDSRCAITTGVSATGGAGAAGTGSGGASSTAGTGNAGSSSLSTAGMSNAGAAGAAETAGAAGI